MPLVMQLLLILAPHTVLQPWGPQLEGPLLTLMLRLELPLSLCLVIQWRTVGFAAQFLGYAWGSRSRVQLLKHGLMDVMDVIGSGCVAD